MSIIIPANSAAGGLGYQVANSLRFNRPSSDSLNRTQSGGSATTKITFSTWIKRTNLGIETWMFDAPNSSNQSDGLRFLTNDTIMFLLSDTYTLTTNRVFRDTSAWYHLVVAMDTTQNTDSNRVKLYVNGVQETSFSATSYPSQNATAQGLFVSGRPLYVGRQSGGNYLDGYLAETVFIDNQALAPTSFGEFDSDSGVWKPIDVSDLTFGTNGAYLDFEDSSALGNDAAGSNNFSVNNLAAIDQTTDTCTNNFCLLNPIDKGYGTINFTEGNTRGEGSGSGWHPARGSMGLSSGKWYWEMNMTGSNQMGVSNETIDMNNDNAQDLVGVTVFYNASGGIIRTDGSQVGGTTATFASDGSDVAGYALDMDNKKLSIYKNGSIIVTNTALSTSITNFALPFFSVNGGGTWSVNFGNPSVALNSAVADGNGYGAFEYAPPTGYFALCTINLSKEMS